MKYGIFSGWYCDEQPRAYKAYGDEFMRSRDCFYLWRHCIEKYTSPQAVIITDSASPIVPDFKTLSSRLDYVRLEQNFGHPARLPPGVQYCGASREVLLGLIYCYVNDFDYAVHVEQGSLLKGERFIERIIEANPDADLIVPSGERTPQPTGYGFFIVSRRGIPGFIKSYTDFPQTDAKLSVERKLLAVTETMPSAVINLKYGRQRPIDFQTSHFFVKHMVLRELEAFCEVVGYDLTTQR